MDTDFRHTPKYTHTLSEPTLILQTAVTALLGDLGASGSSDWTLTRRVRAGSSCGTAKPSALRVVV
jgi:hypothetical protein